MKKKGRPLLNWIYAGQRRVSRGAGGGRLFIAQAEHEVDSVTIELADIKKKNEKPKAPPPPPPPPPPPTEKPKPPPPPQAQTKAKMAAEAPKDAPAPEALDSEGFADLGGVALGNGGGGGGGGAGVAVAGPARAMGPVAAARPAPTATTRKVQALQQTASEACNEPDAKPKHITQRTPKIHARGAGWPRSRASCGSRSPSTRSGNVISARVLSGLGYGLDEAALGAAKGWTFRACYALRQADHRPHRHSVSVQLT